MQVPAALPAVPPAVKQFPKGTQDTKRNTLVHPVPLRMQPLSRDQVQNRAIFVCQRF